MGARVITGRHVLYGMLGFFGAVVAANAVFIFLAIDTFTGLSTDDPYRRGVAYNETLAARAEQQALGWRAEVVFDETRPGYGVLRAILRDRNGAPLTDMRVSGQIRRPTHDGHDRDLTLTGAGDGTYAAELALPLRGQWDVRLTVEARDGKRFEMERRLWLK